MSLEDPCCTSKLTLSRCDLSSANQDYRFRAVESGSA